MRAWTSANEMIFIMRRNNIVRRKWIVRYDATLVILGSVSLLDKVTSRGDNHPIQPYSRNATFP